MSNTYVLSKHYYSASWVAIQREYLDAFMNVPHVRAFTREGVDDRVFRPSEVLLDFPLTPEEVAVKSTDAMASWALERASDDDWLLFLDSDAFPIADVRPLYNLGMDLVAVQRLENGDFHPHPCFTLVRAGLWRDIQATWVAGPWTSTRGQVVNEMGGQLIKLVEQQEVPWVPLHRVNIGGLHPLWFGVYGLGGITPMVYHHGAGSRLRISRSDLQARRAIPGVLARRMKWALSNKRARRLNLNLAQALRADKEVTDEAVVATMRNNYEFWKILL